MSAGSDKFSVTPDDKGNVTLRFYDGNLNQRSQVNFDPSAFAEFVAVINSANSVTITCHCEGRQ